MNELSKLYRVAITCEDCGRRHRLLEKKAIGQVVWIVCHDCEKSVKVTVTSAPAPSAPAEVGK